MPVSNNGANLSRLRRLCSDPDEDDRGRQDQEGRDRVHDDAQGTMIDVTCDRMRIRCVDHAKQQKQNQAHHERQPQSYWARMAMVSQVCQRCIQVNILDKIARRIWGKEDRISGQNANPDSNSNGFDDRVWRKFQKTLGLSRPYLSISGGGQKNRDHSAATPFCRLRD